jgi:hypothetical protein
MHRGRTKQAQEKISNFKVTDANELLFSHNLFVIL